MERCQPGGIAARRRFSRGRIFPPEWPPPPLVWSTDDVRAACRRADVPPLRHGASLMRHGASLTRTGRRSASSEPARRAGKGWRCWADNGAGGARRGVLRVASGRVLHRDSTRWSQILLMLCIYIRSGTVSYRLRFYLTCIRHELLHCADVVVSLPTSVIGCEISPIALNPN